MRKRKNTGRLLSILLCLMMVLGMFPTAVLAAEGGASAEDSGIITEKLLREISVVKHVRQTGTEHLRLRPLSLKWRTRLGMRSIPFPTTVLVWRN